MLPRAERLKTSQFSVAFSQGRMVRHPLLVLRIHRSPKTQTCRAAFIVAKKLAPAAKRNRVRRCIREIYRLHALRREARLQSCNLIFAATPAALEASHEALQEAMDNVLRRAVRIDATQSETTRGRSDSQNARPAKAGFEN